MWVPLSLGTAVFAGLADTLAKKALEKSRYSTIAFVRLGWAVLFIWPLFPWAPRPAVLSDFLLPVALALPLEIAAILMFQRALQISPLSLAIPYLAFTPVFLLVIGRVFLNQAFTAQGVTGILLVVTGTFVLQNPPHRFSLGFWKKLFPREKGPRLMLATAFLFSITSLLAKQSLQASSPVYFSAIYFSLNALGLLFFQGGSKTWARELVNRPGLFATIGALEAAGLLLQFNAMLIGEVAYVVALKRLSLLLSVVMGWLVFKESHILSRAAGAALMTAGAVLIGLA